MGAEREIIFIDEEKCTGCGICVDIGHCYAITMEDEKAKIFIENCTGCSTCTDICPVGAMSMDKYERIVEGTSSG